jgi:hypothetical protein
MSCGCETVQICLAGKTYNAFLTYGAQGTVQLAEYIDENLTKQTLAPGSFAFGACDISAKPDVRRFLQPLVAGNNVIPHAFGSSPVEVEVRNNATGALISATVAAEAINSVTLFVPVAVASVRISIDA